MNAFDFKNQPSIWTRDEKMRRLAQGEEYAKRRQEKYGINHKNQVFIYTKSQAKRK